MYIYKKPSPSVIKFEAGRTRGETMEMKVERMISNQEPIKDGAPDIYTERKDGVQAGYNIRTDRFEVAADAMDAVHKSNLAKRDSVGKPEALIVDIEPTIEDSGAESIGGTSEM